MTTRTILSLALAAGLGACAAPGAVGPTVSRPVVPYTSAGLERVIGQDAAGLVRLFGQPDADIREGAARKLQFAGPICVLDAYLYLRENAGPRVTYLDAREPDGSTIDIDAESLCVHGDSPGSVELARRIVGALQDAGIEIRSFL